MSTTGKFYAANGQFWLNDQPQLIQAGEFHYFRTPKEEWSHRLGLLKQAGFNTVAAYIPWLWHQLEEGVSDLDGHSHALRDLAGFLDLAAAMDLWIIARPGPYIMAETINEGIPPWVFTNYPQVAFVNQKQELQNIVSYQHPDFLACVAKWYEAVFEVLTPRQITQGGKILMIQLDNEMGMPLWVRNMLDVNPDTIQRFVAYLPDVYGKHLSQRYPTDDLAAFLKEAILKPTAVSSAKVISDYRRFYRTYLREYMTFLWDEAKANGMDVLPIVNIHGFMNGGKTFPIGLSQLIEVMEMADMVSATDVYPLFIGEANFHQLLWVNEATKALQNKKQALFSIEFQAGGNNDFGNGQSSLYDLHSRLCISCGMRAINHYLFFDGENSPVLSPIQRHAWGHPVRKDGSLRRHYARYPELSEVLNAYGTDLILAQPEKVATIGFLLDNFMTEVNNAFTQEATRIITHQREVILCDMIARGLALTQRPFDAIELTRASLAVEQIPVLWVMMEKQCPAEVQQKLVDYVQQGGKLILAGRICVEDFLAKPCTILKEALGIEQVTAGMQFRQSFLTVFQYEGVPTDFVESYTGQFAEVFATDTNGQTVGFIQALGQGKVLLFGAAVAANTLEDVDIVHQMALQMDNRPLFTLSDWVDVRLSVGENGRFLFLNNYQDDPVETTIVYQHVPLFGGAAVCLPPRRGLILPLDWRLGDDVTIHYITSEITEIIEEETTLTLKTRSPHFTAELTASGYQCNAGNGQTSGGNGRFKLHGTNGAVVLRKQV